VLTKCYSDAHSHLLTTTTTNVTHNHNNNNNNNNNSTSKLIMMNFDESNVDTIKTMVQSQFSSGDLVVLIQTGAFYLNEYRIRLELFDRGLKTIEHVHLGLMPHEQYATYVDSLAFDHTAPNGSQLAHKLKDKIHSSNRFIVYTGSQSQPASGSSKQQQAGEEEEEQMATLVYDTPMEPALLNLGDYSGMKNVGGTFPVGEVFTEPRDLSAVSGEAYVFGFPNIERKVEILEKPFKIRIERGVVTWIAPDAPESFTKVLQLIGEGEGEVVVREFGIGLNEGPSKRNPLNDVTAFERQKGLHISLGKKHTVFSKPEIKKKRTRFHIDVFLDVQSIVMDEQVVYKNGQFRV